MGVDPTVLLCDCTTGCGTDGALHSIEDSLNNVLVSRRIMRPTDVPDQGLLCDLLWSDPDKDTMGWGENDRGVSFTFGAEVVAKFLHKHDFDLICRAHQVHGHDHDNLSSVLMWPLLQVVEDGYEFFAKRQLVTLFSAPNYCGEFDNAGTAAAEWLITSQTLFAASFHCDTFQVP